MRIEPHPRRALPCIAVTGEARSGKSSLINALLGASVLPTGVGDQIGLPVLVSYASKPSLVLEHANRRRVATDWVTMAHTQVDAVRRLRLGLPIDLLKSSRLVETPGFASGCDGLDRRAFAVCRQASAAIWCTPAMQAWKASERDAWLALHERFRGRSILAVTYKDAIASEKDHARLSARLRAEAAPHFGKVVMIASQDAMRARQLDCRDASDALWQASGGAELCAAVRTLIAGVAPSRELPRS